MIQNWKHKFRYIGGILILLLCLLTGCTGTATARQAGQNRILPGQCSRRNRMQRHRRWRNRELIPRKRMWRLISTGLAIFRIIFITQEGSQERRMGQQ